MARGDSKSRSLLYGQRRVSERWARFNQNEQRLWQEAGFADQADATSWKESGFGPAAAGQWRDLGLSLEEASTWISGGGPPSDETRAWIAAGIRRMREASAWAPINPQDVPTWQKTGIPSPAAAGRLMVILQEANPGAGLRPPKGRFARPDEDRLTRKQLVSRMGHAASKLEKEIDAWEDCPDYLRHRGRSLRQEIRYMRGEMAWSALDRTSRDLRDYLPGSSHQPPEQVQLAALRFLFLACQGNVSATTAQELG